MLVTISAQVKEGNKLVNAGGFQIEVADMDKYFCDIRYALRHNERSGKISTISDDTTQDFISRSLACCNADRFVVSAAFGHKVGIDRERGTCEYIPTSRNSFNSVNKLNFSARIFDYLG